MPRLRSLPTQPVMRDLYRAYPATCKPLGEFTEAAMRGPSPFTQAQRELAAYVSGLNACEYCHETHVAVLVTALFNFYNRLVDGVGLALPENYPAEAGKRLSTQGYDVYAQTVKPG